MAEERFELSRRRLLATLGTIGVASGGAGMGTSAYFSDEETFDGNQLVAGELDVKVDWQEHYYDGSEDENDDRSDDATNGLDDTDDDDGVGEFDVVATGGDPANVPTGYVGLPHPREPLVAVPWLFLDDFLLNTATEAYPDEDGDGVQDAVDSREDLRRKYVAFPSEEIERLYRAQFADVPQDLERPLVSLDDVKPGDFGEVTFSFHLFDNPGYVWMVGDLLEATENGVVEPEAADPDEDQVEGSGDPDLKDPDGDAEKTVELLDAIRVAVWHDDGDNVLAEEEWVDSPHAPDSDGSIELTREQAEVTRGTLREVLSDLSDGIPLDADPTTAERECFPNSTTRYLGFAWWLPVDHANEIQTDRVRFDLGFYTEQCRHNDGAGTPPPL